MKHLYLSILLLLSLGACTPQPPQYDFQDPDKPIEARVENLLSLLTLEEKVGQMMHEAPAIDRLGIPSYNWWNECLHGVARSGQATVFPQAIGMAATFDNELIFNIATAISDEARAKHHDFKKRGWHDYYQGLTYWTPNINIFRDPRWGRGMETYGEDPLLTSRMGVAFIKGLQGDDPNHFKLIATPKHYVVHSGPEYNRHSFDAVADMYDFYMTYLPAFDRAIKEANAQSVMCAYNRTNGEVCCGSDELLNMILRHELKFNGYIVSDCGAISNFYNEHEHHVVNTPAEAAAKAVRAGTDLNCGETYHALIDAVKQGLLKDSDIDVSLGRLLKARFQLGMFDPDERVAYSRIPLTVVECKEHVELAREAARKSMVLLKNDKSILPLSKDKKRIAVIGPNADNVETLYANYNGFSKNPVTALQGIKKKLQDSEILYAQGCNLANGLPYLTPIPTDYLFTDASCTQHGVTGHYFDNDTLAGNAVLTRRDPNIDFNWWHEAPLKELDPRNFSVRWTGYLKAPATGEYYLGYHSAYLSMWVDNQLIGSTHDVHHPTKSYKKLTLEAGKVYELKLELKRHRGMAFERLLWQRPDSHLQEEAIAAASQSDIIILCMGLSPLLEGEEMNVDLEGFYKGDRNTLDLPAPQLALMKELKKLNKPMVLVLMNGSAVSINWEKENMNAILEAWYPGQEGGNAIADILFGDYNPGGKLPVTFYKSVNDLPDFENYSMKGHTYRYFEKETLWNFGYGLSYTTFQYNDLTLMDATPGQIKVKVNVSNTGKMDGDDVVQVYVRKVSPRTEHHPRYTLAGFKRISLKKEERKEVVLALDDMAFMELDDNGQKVIGKGSYELFVGADSKKIVKFKID